MDMNLINKVTKDQVKLDMPEIRTGDTVKVYVKVREGQKERIQLFEGLVMKTQGRGVQRTVTVRKISYGIGVERAFPINSATIDKIEVVKHAKVRQSRIYYMRNLRGKSARLKEIRVNKTKTPTIRKSAARKAAK